MMRDYLASKPEVMDLRKDLIEATAECAFSVSMDNEQNTKEASSYLNRWQAKNRIRVNCLQLLPKPVAKFYEDVFRRPDIDLTLLPSYSFVFQFTFTLAQPYISRDEQDFYIIDNPIRKDKILKLPYVASTSWKGSLRSAFWRERDEAESEHIRRLFGNEKKGADEPGSDDAQDLQAGRLYFYPTFFTVRSLEIINPQDRRLRSGRLPIPFESVPQGAGGIFTLLYVPFDPVGLDEATRREQAAKDMGHVARGLRALFRDYGFGAKTSSGFGLANEDLREVRGEIRTQGIQKFPQMPDSFDTFVGAADELAEAVKNAGKGK
jgi:CRISPR-associated protein Cmr2